MTPSPDTSSTFPFLCRSQNIVLRFKNKASAAKAPHALWSLSNAARILVLNAPIAVTELALCDHLVVIHIQ
jgi:hypothetical protein